MARLHEFLTARRAEIIRHWTESIKHALAPAPLTRLELIDHLPQFLDEITAILSRFAAGDGPTPETPTAADHGGQRLRLGFDLQSLVREYGMLRRTIVTLVIQDGTEIAPADFDVLFECLISGIADAVTQYTAEREAERQRQSSEHFAFIAHELRNPLSTAMLALRSLREKALVPLNRQSEVLDRSMSRMHDLIQHSLGLAFIGSGVELRRESVSVKELLAEATVEAAVEADEKGVKLSLPEGLPDAKLQLDRRLILSAVNNLVRNAVKFTKPGSTVEVRYRRDTSTIAIEVEDACGGLADDQNESLFQPFVQANKDRSGFGLGLAIARQAAEAHGGTVKVRNLPNKGCCFTLELPA